EFPYLTTANGTQYTTIVSTDDEDPTVVSVQKYGPGNPDWISVPFTFSEVNSVSWSWPYGGHDNFYLNTNPIHTGADYYAAVTAVAKETATPGAYDVRATFYDGSGDPPYIDLTLIIPETNPQTSTSVTVEIDASKVQGFTISNTVNAGNNASYNYATPFTALDKMKTDGNITNYDGTGGFVNSITAQGSTIETNTSTGDGWQYRVYHKAGNTYVMDPSSETLGSSAFKLGTNDYVKWVYCTYDEATPPSTYFPYSFPAN
ncbi:MAG: hypothetical protein Q4D71_12660, partial [Oscillospiraceae bacterium]|nr:hypothetical protein [Oscillospiraceae bacterium]